MLSRSYHTLLRLVLIDKPMIDAERHAVLFRELGKNRLLVRGRRIFAHRPCTAITVTYDVMVRIKFDCTRRDTSEKILCSDTLRFFFRRALFCFVLSHFYLQQKKAALLIATRPFGFYFICYILCFQSCPSSSSISRPTSSVIAVPGRPFK